MYRDWSATLVESPTEAARYALTRRLLPVLRHHLVVHLQPIGMIYEVLERKLAAPEPDLAAVREGLAKINHLARSAVNSSLDVVAWLAPEGPAEIGVGKGVGDCLEMLSGNFRFRGFTIHNHIEESSIPVSQTALREVFTAALISLTDGAVGPIDLVLAARLSSTEAVISVTTKPSEGTGFTSEMAYRPMTWQDVVSLASAHQVELTRADDVATLTFNILKSAPVHRADAAGQPALATDLQVTRGG